MDRQDDPRDAAELGAFLRAARERLRPADFGVAAGRRRRTPGLRREEVAALCGVSPTWYTWIEQGRDVAASAATLRALADGLRLGRVERAHLFRLAGRTDPDPVPAAVADVEPLRLLLDAVDAPAYVLDRHWDVVAWNLAAVTLFEGWLAADASSPPNLLRYVFLDPAAARLIVDWETRAERLVAEYRADSVGLHHDAAHLALVAELSRRSELFDRAWRAQRVVAREGGGRAFAAAEGAARVFEQFTLKPALRPDLKLIVLAPQRQPPQPPPVTLTRVSA
jgi:transcriptional regulator with XRE-family HTH domain